MNTYTSVFRHYWPFIKAHPWGNVLILVTFGAGGILGTAIEPLFFKHIIDLMAAGADNPETVIVPLVKTFAGLVGVIVAVQLLLRTADVALTRVQSVTLKEIADYTYQNLQKHSYQFFINSFTGSLVAKSKRFVDSFETLQDTFVFQIWMNGLALLTMFGILMWLSPLLGGLFVVWLVLYVLMTIWFIRRKVKKDLVHAEAKTRTTGALSDAIANTLTIKMFATAQSENTYFAGVTQDEYVVRSDTWRFDNFQRFMQALFLVLFEIAAMALVLWLWHQGTVTAGAFVLVQVYLMGLFNITWNLGRNMTRIFTSLTDAKEMTDILDKQIGVADSAQPEPVRITNGNITFNNVTFAYSGGRTIFENFSLNIKAGQKVGLVGHSGAGKTTITKLLLRFADVRKGAILIDGQNIANITQEDLRRHISYVPQEPLLFHRTLRENIGYGKPDATEEEIIEVAKRARAHEFIERLPQGYDTLVGERGIKLSGGERQRVAIARAMLKDAPILILDEATSSLDSLSERKIQEAFAELMKGKTALVVAHRLSTISQMDRILVFDKGKVVEEGTHAQLVMKRGVYAELWNEQAGGFLGE